MKERVWLLADADTGDVGYFHHGRLGEEDQWRLIGPVAYSHRVDAEAAARNPTFLPAGVESRLVVMDVEAASFVQAIFNGFPPSDTDVFILDGNLFPLTVDGGHWIDDALEAPIWAPLFEDTEWFGRVLEQVAHVLDMTMETVTAIGDINAAAEDEAVEAQQAASLVQQHVRVAIVPEKGTLALEQKEHVHHLSPAARFWLYTQGLCAFQIPELEMREVPALWVVAAGTELNAWAAYALDRGIDEGEVLRAGGPVPLEVTAVPSDDPFWERQKTPCLRLELTSVLFPVSPAGSEAKPTVH